MPIHEWTRIPAGLFHHFHQDWSIEIARELNRGRLPASFSALVEQRSGPQESDDLAIESVGEAPSAGADRGNTLIAEPPVTRIVRRTTKELYSGRANRIVVRHHLGRIVAVIEIVSPGNKDSRAALRNFVEKTADFLRAGIHALIVDLFPPTPRDPFGIHKVIWDEFEEEDFEFPEGKDRVLASYQTGGQRVAYVEPVAVGDELPEMPLFLAGDLHVAVPLESTYQAAWDASPQALRTAVQAGAVPESSAD
jgi:hypothetical protein